MSLIKNKDSGNFYPVHVECKNWKSETFDTPGHLPITINILPYWKCDDLWSTHEGNFNGSGCVFGCKYCSRQKYNCRFKKPSGLHRSKGEWINDRVLRIRKFGQRSVFVNPYSDLFTFPEYDIKQIFEVCNYSVKRGTKFIFQTKDPGKYFDYLDLIPSQSWIGTTIETDLFLDSQYYVQNNISKAPFIADRYLSMLNKDLGVFKRFVTIEPIMQFSKELIRWMGMLNPDLIFIGANTSKINLPEPTKDELQDLIYALYDVVGVPNVYLKSNIRRLIPAFYDGWKLAEEQNKCLAIGTLVSGTLATSNRLIS